MGGIYLIGQITEVASHRQVSQISVVDGVNDAMVHKLHFHLDIKSFNKI